MKKIIVKIEGGLGNQMFQYAFGRNLSLIHNVQFKIDSSYLRETNQSNRVLTLDKLNTTLEEASSKEIAAYDNTLSKLLSTVGLRGDKVVEKSNTFDGNILNRTRGYFVGHWNREEYFKQNSGIIRKDFTLQKPLGNVAEEMKQEIASATNPISVHVRRTDYITIPKVANVLVSLPLSYYEKAISEITRRFPDTHFFISSDDIEWAKENLKIPYPTTFISKAEIPDYEELFLQSFCKHHIIANSTFSWWGAWLNQNTDKVVIAPNTWFTDPERNNHAPILGKWVKI